MTALSKVKVVVRNEKVTIVHATAGPQGTPGLPGTPGTPGQDAALPEEWTNPPTLTLYFEDGMN